MPHRALTTLALLIVLASAAGANLNALTQLGHFTPPAGTG